MHRREQSMPDDILSPYLSETDRAACLRTLTLLRSLVTDERRQLVFFVGAGISANTGMPLVFELLGTLLMDALKRSVPDKADSETLQKTITRASQMLGFEITLNSLWNSCPEAIRRLFCSLADFERNNCFPYHAHKFLARKLAADEVVITTNHDHPVEGVALNAVNKILI